MQFRTPYSPENPGFFLSPTRPAILLGSCFSDNIASKMQESMWDALNPFGTLYNPESIALAIESLILDSEAETVLRKSLFKDNKEIFHSFLLDSRFSSRSEDEVIRNGLKAAELMKEKLKEAEALFITFGTSICYYLLSDRQEQNCPLNCIVSNCHKLPAKMFGKYRLSVEEITSRWISICEKLKQLFPKLKIIFTVSPVRHLKDGFVLNSLSKATLLLSIDKIISSLDYCYRFPAFEIMNDDLRDYRFYSSDMAHPSEQAVEYIWNIFKETYLDSQGLNLIKEGNRLLKGYNHRPLIATDEEKKEYKLEMKQQINSFILKHPGMKFQE